ncbi:Probable inactive receptor kinase At4g23740 [Linum perenne]
MENQNPIKLSYLFTAIIFLAAVSFPVTTISEPFEDKEALLDFIRNVEHSFSPNWDESLPLCFLWTGVTCNVDNSRVEALNLTGMGIRGTIPSNTLSRLTAIQIVNLRSNGISGGFPSDFVKLRNLTEVYLESNNFTGPLPSDFSAWRNLTVLDLSGNGFNGSIPPSISSLSHLVELNLSNNSLSGSIPDIDIPTLQQLNLTNNHLTGTVPRSLLRYPGSALSGNDLEMIVTPALAPANLIEPPSSQPFVMKSGGKLSEPAILGVVLGSCVVGFVIVAGLMIGCYSKKGRKKDGLPSKSQKKDDSLKMKALEIREKGKINNRLEFFESCSLAFDLEDLLRASAEVLGKGTYGTTYKAALEDLTTVVVKRLKEVTVTRKDFEQQMAVVGSIRHENVAPLRAYYYSKDEKLMVHDFYNVGSVSTMLHGRRGEGRMPLDWEARMRIAVGAARGIAYIHTQQTSKLVHGNIRSSNIFLNSEGYGCVSDVGLATLMSPMPAPVSRAAGYRAPEIADPRKSTLASDVYSFGVLLLELLTGKSPTHATGSSSRTDEAVHLVRWVNSVVREEWTGEVFDVELLRYPNIEEEMVEMLQIGMNCTVRMPDKRPKMADVVKMVEGIRRMSHGSQAMSSSDAGVEIAMSTPTPPASSEAGTSSAMG